MFAYVISLVTKTLDFFIITSTTAHMLLDVLQMLFIVKLLRSAIGHLFAKTYENLTREDFYQMFGEGLWADALYNLYYCQFDLNGNFSVVCTLIMKLSEGVGKLSLHKWMSSILIPASVQVVGNWILLISVIVLSISLIAGFIDDYFISPRVALMKAYDARPRSLIEHTDKVLCKEYKRMYPNTPLSKSESTSSVRRIPAQGLRAYWLERDLHSFYFTLLQKLKQFGQLIRGKLSSSSSDMVKNAFDSLSRIGYFKQNIPLSMTRSQSDPNMHDGSPSHVSHSAYNATDCRGSVQGRSFSPLKFIYRSSSPFFGFFSGSFSPVSQHDPSATNDSSGKIHVLQVIRAVRAHLESGLNRGNIHGLVCDDNVRESNGFVLNLRVMHASYDFFRKVNNQLFKTGKLGPVVLPSDAPSGFKQVKGNLQWIIDNIPQAFRLNPDKYGIVRRFIEDRCLPALCLFYNLELHDSQKPGLSHALLRKRRTSGYLKNAFMHSHHARIIKIIMALMQERMEMSSNGIADRLANLLVDANVSQFDDADSLASMLDLPLVEDGLGLGSDDGFPIDLNQIPKCLKRYALYLEQAYSPVDEIKRSKSNPDFSLFSTNSSHVFTPIRPHQERLTK